MEDRISDLNILPDRCAVEAVDVSKNPDCTIRDVAAIVERDTVLAADIIAVANSALYSIGAPILAVQQALNRLGLRLGHPDPGQRHGFHATEGPTRRVESGTAHASRTGDGHDGSASQQDIEYGYQGEEFTTGLLHDIGRILLAVCLPEQFAQVDQKPGLQ
ncbi:MAG: HDOD domain-containing protein [Planctomycetaceae bacterium]